LKCDPQLCQLEKDVQKLMRTVGDNQAFSTAKRRVTNYHKKLKLDALRQYQDN